MFWVKLEHLDIFLVSYRSPLFNYSIFAAFLQYFLGITGKLTTLGPATTTTIRRGKHYVEVLAEITLSCQVLEMWFNTTTVINTIKM